MKCISSQQSQLLEAVANIMLQIMENYQTEVPNCKCKSCNRLMTACAVTAMEKKPAEIYDRRKHIFCRITSAKGNAIIFAIAFFRHFSTYHLSFAHICDGNLASSVMTIKKENSWHYSASVAPRCFPRLGRLHTYTHAKTAESILGLWRMRHEDWRPQGAAGMSDRQGKVDEKNMQLVKRRVLQAIINEGLIRGLRFLLTAPRSLV